MRVYPFVFTSTDEGGIAAYYNYAGTDLCASREQSQACLSYAETKQSVRSNRVAARLGSGGLSYDTTCVTDNGEVAKRSDELFWNGVKLLNGRGNKPEDFKEMSLVDAKGKEVDWLKKIDLDKLAMSWQLEAKIDPGKIHSVIDDNSYPAMSGNIRYENEPDVYFYHSDHLGGASWITDVNGKPVQHLQYLPFGEPYVNQHPAGYQERFTFTGKEMDEETGYGYFGARYMDHELMTMWLSVDPMADKYPNISPYAYCAWNPVKLVDPDGNEAMTNDDWYKSTTKNSNGDYSVFWSPENAQTISVNGETYTNIGSSYIHSTEQGVTFYEQNSVTAFFPYLPVKDLSLSDKGTDFLFGNEGVRLKPYNDSKGYATIGVGHLIAKRNVTEQDKRNWSGFTQSDAINLFQQDVQSFENGIKSSVNVNLTQYQYDAIVSFAFNIGMGNFKKSEFLMSLNNGNYNGNLMMNFHRPPEIVPRRQREVNLFNDATY